MVPGYGGGMSSAKAALESDTRVLAFEAGRKWGHRVNVISAGPYASRAASAIGFIEQMIDYAKRNAPLPEALTAEEVGATAAFLCSPLASGITGTTVYVDKGYHAMGIAVDREGPGAGMSTAARPWRLLGCRAAARRSSRLRSCSRRFRTSAKRSTTRRRRATTTLAELNPLAQVPTVVLPDGTVMTESAAIMLYIDGLVPELGLVPACAIRCAASSCAG